MIFLTDVNDYATRELACDTGTANINKYLSPGTTEPTASQYVYDNAGLTSTYDGNNSWHLMSYGGNTWGVNIDTDGLITVAIAC